MSAEYLIPGESDISLNLIKYGTYRFSFTGQLYRNEERDRCIVRKRDKIAREIERNKRDSRRKKEI